MGLCPLPLPQYWMHTIVHPALVLPSCIAPWRAPALQWPSLAAVCCRVLGNCARALWSPALSPCWLPYCSFMCLLSDGKGHPLQECWTFSEPGHGTFLHSPLLDELKALEKILDEKQGQTGNDEYFTSDTEPASSRSPAPETLRADR